jgi:putative hemolysin
MVLVIIVILLVLSAFFSAAETSLTSISKAKIHLLKKQKKIGIASLIYLRRHPGKMLTSILIGNNLVNILASSLATVTLVEQFQKAGYQDINFLIAVISLVMTAIILLFSEVTPKNVAIYRAESIALWAAPVIYGLSLVLTPFIVLFNYISSVILWFMKVPPLSKGTLVSKEEIIAMIDAGKEQGVLAEEETKMLEGVFEFKDKTVGEIMTPLAKVVSAEINLIINEIEDLIERRPHSRLPVYEKSRNNIIGLLYAKDLLLVINEDNRLMTIKDFKAILRKPFFVKENEKISVILRQMRSYRAHLAVVKGIDELAVGIVTIEDILEEIVGDISDEYEY